jgi:hypothetical protein
VGGFPGDVLATHPAGRHSGIRGAGTGPLCGQRGRCSDMHMPEPRRAAGSPVRPRKGAAGGVGVERATRHGRGACAAARFFFELKTKSARRTAKATRGGSPPASRLPLKPHQIPRHSRPQNQKNGQRLQGREAGNVRCTCGVTGELRCPLEWVLCSYVFGTCSAAVKRT